MAAYIGPDNLLELGYKWDASLLPNITEICDTASRMVDAHIQRVLPGKLSLFENVFTEENIRVRVFNGTVRFFYEYYGVSQVHSMVVYFGECTVSAENFKIHSKEQCITAKVSVPNGEYYATANYTAGYIEANLPGEIKKATILIAQSLLSEYFMVKNFNISQLTQFKQGSLQFQRSSKLLNIAIPPTAQVLLAEYRRVR